VAQSQRRYGLVLASPLELNGTSMSVGNSRLDHHDGRSWNFAVQVRLVDGSEGVWLRDELAVHTRRLLEWARDDASVGDAPGAEEEMAA
jgi:hypothetical protein